MYFAGVEGRGKVSFICFWSLNDKDKSMTNAFCGNKLLSNLCVVYLHVTLQEKRCVLCI